MTNDTVRLLLFEDDTEYGELLVKHLFKAWGKSLQKDLTILWLKAGFSILDTVETSPNNRKPLAILEASEAQPASSIAEEISARGREPRAGHEIWQCNIDGAILDVRDASTGAHFGEDLAEWLEIARFSGPVVLISVGDLPVAPHPLLPNLMVLSKPSQRADGFRIISTFMEPLLPTNKRAIQSVGARGWNPADTEALARYLAIVGRKHQINQWSCLYVGEDAGAKDKLLRFFSFTDFEERLKLVLRFDFANWGESLDKAFGTPNLKHLHVVFLDHGDVLKDVQGITQQIDLLENQGKGWKIPCWPQVVVLTDRIRSMTEASEQRLFKSGVMIVPRKRILETPTLWAELSAEEFVTNWLLYTSTKSADRSDGRLQTGGPGEKGSRRYAKKLFASFLAMRLLGRSRTAISGIDRPSVVRWFCSYPLSGEAVTQTFEKRYESLFAEVAPDLSPWTQKNFKPEPRARRR